MPTRVYECEPSEANALKKLLTYDPYLDPNLIPKTKELDEKEMAKLPPEEQQKIKDQDAAAKAAVDKLRNDKLANVIFARQDTDFRDGKSLGIETNNYFLLIKATDEWLDLAEQRLKRDFKTVKRAKPDDEKNFIKKKEDEENAANAGFGAIFGG